MVRNKHENRLDYKLNRFKFDGRLYSQMAYTKTKYLNTFFKVEKKTHNTDIALKTRGHFMTNMMDDIAHLSQEIGPRPAGTEEEQQAALYIADELQKSAGFSTIVEDVSCASNGNTVRAICFGLAFVCALLPIVFPVLSIPCFIIGFLAAALFACEVFGKPILSRFLRSGVSQNVVAKYNPLSITNTNKRRKIILVTHYDSARVATEYQGIIGRYLPIIHNVCAITLAVAPIVLLIKMVFFASETGGFAIVLLVLQIICVVLLALPLASIIKRRFSAYNDAANNDASGVAVLLDVARTVGNGLISKEEMEEHAREAGVAIHGEDAAYEAGVVPDGVEVTYQARENRMTPEESLAAAKAAIAAFTGKPVADKVPLSDISSKLVQHGGLEDTAEEAAAAAVHFAVEEEDSLRYKPSNIRTATPVTAPAPSEKTTTVPSQIAAEENAEQPVETQESFVRETVEALQPGATGMGSSYQKQVPSWARAAQEKAHANKPDLAREANVSRSRFADAPAAHMADAARQRNAAPTIAERLAEQNAVVAAETGATQEAPIHEEPESELAKRVAALRQEIDGAAAPLLKKSPHEGEEDAASVKETVVREREVIAEEPASVVSVASRATEGETSEDNFEEIDETFISEEPVIIPVMEEDAPSASSRKSSVKRKTAAHRTHAKRNGIGGFLNRASDMVSSAASKVTHRHEDELDVDQVDDGYYDEIEVDGHTIAMSPIDVEQFNEDKPLSSSEEDFSNQASSQETMISSAAFDEDAVYAGKNTDTAQAEIDYEAEPASPIMGMEDMGTANTSVAQQNDDALQSDRHVIVLPDVVAPVGGSIESAKQRAPMAVDDEKTMPQPALLSNMLPRIGADQLQHQVEMEASEQRTLFKTPGLELPDFNTNDFERIVVPPIDVVGSDTINGSSNEDLDTTLTDLYVDEESFAPSSGSAGNTGTFADVSTELSGEYTAEDDYIEDADDSVYEEGYTQTGAFAGPDYVEMPKSRVGRIFGRFGKKKKAQDEQSVREWVDVDASYEAQSVGKERGSWESFRSDDDLDAEFIDVDYGEVNSNERGWNGGAFSLQSLRNHVSGTVQGQGVEVDDDLVNEEASAGNQHPMKRSVPKDVKIAEEINNEMRLLRDFRHPDIDTEVWFVALGAEEALNSGMTAFLEEHQDELKGAIIVNLEGVGAGRFSFIDEEGQYRPNKVSSRIKRVLRQASEKSGVTFATNKLLSRNTSAHVAAQHGLQAVTLAGMSGNQTAFYGSADDVLENIKPNVLEENSKFVLELLKSM